MTYIFSHILHLHTSLIYVLKLSRNKLVGGSVRRSGTTWLFLAVEEAANLFRGYIQHVLIVLLHFDPSVIEVKDKL